MSPNTVSAPGQDTEKPQAPFPPAPVEEVLRLFGKAARARQLYLPNNPIFQNATDAVRAAFASLWTKAEELELTLTETEIRWFEHVVLEEPTKSADSLPWLFYKDGVRELRLSAGFEQMEVETLLDLLQRVRKASPDEDDLLTLLWEADFVHLRYRYVDLGMEPAAPLADGVEVEHSPEANEVRAVVRDDPAPTAAGIVNLADFDTTLYFLDEREIDYLRDEIRREYDADLRVNVVALLLDIFEQQTGADVRTEVSEILESMMLHLLSAGRLRTVAYLLREAQVAVQRGRDVTPEQRTRLTELPARLSAPEALSQLLQGLDESIELPPSEELAELFEQLRPAALGTVFRWLPKLESASLRPLLEQAADRLASANTAELVRLIGEPDATVAAEAIRRSGALKTQAAVPPLGKVLTDGDTDLRQLAVAALAEIGSAGAMQALERGVEDPDRDVRLAAARSLATKVYRPALARVEAVIKGKAIREADRTEKMAFFEAYGVLAGDASTAHLDSLLNGKSFFGRREDPEIRACAAVALGRVNSDKAREALRRSADDKDVVVRSAVSRALKGGTA